MVKETQVSLALSATAAEDRAKEQAARQAQTELELKAAHDDLAAKTEAAKQSGAALQAAMVAKESEILKSLTDDHQALQQIVTRPENL